MDPISSTIDTLDQMTIAMTAFYTVTGIQHILWLCPIGESSVPLPSYDC